MPAQAPVEPVLTKKAPALKVYDVISNVHRECVGAIRCSLPISFADARERLCALELSDSFVFLLDGEAPLTKTQEQEEELTADCKEILIRLNRSPEKRLEQARHFAALCQTDERAKTNVTQAATKANNNNDNNNNNQPKQAEQTEEELIKQRGFRTFTEKKVHKDTGEVSTVDYFLVNEEAIDMKNYLRSITDRSEFYDREPKIRLADMLFYVNKLRAFLASNKTPRVKCLEPVLKFLEEEHKETISKIEAMVSDGEICFPYLWFLFEKGTKFVTKTNGGEDVIGSSVSDTRFRCSFFGSSFQILGNLVKSNGRKFWHSQEWFQIREYDGLKKISDLPLRPMTDEEYEGLVARGRKYASLATNAAYRRYSGCMIRKLWCSVQRIEATGRVMVDGTSFQKFNPSYQGFRHNDDDKTMDQVPENLLFQCWPRLPGFSFAAKKWGELHIDDLSDVRFDEDAYQHLVMDPTKKSLIRALVSHSDAAFTDVISGKGSGCVFLLHGPPGTGKTLTAEAIAEVLHRPLYSVSVGELGTTTKELEDKLSQILSICSFWQAVLLIDEADIFLEARSEKDIQRNALVGIFLRLLEYHQGVLFLTTNRVKQFDSAFHSRISVALNYKSLDEQARRQVWQNLLSAAKIPSQNLDLDSLATIPLNGRQVKNVIRLSQTLAKDEGKDQVEKAHILRTVEIARQFERDLQTDLSGKKEAGGGAQ
eukprot:m.186589 g.186589  ORF g.186589 m.186589 type:complete len:709 (+) comp25594_c0_seq1:1489-3615(+)